MDDRSEERIRQNLIDAGCDKATISDFFKTAGTDRLTQQLMLLRRHRQKLLDGIHKRQNEIDCLDYLIMQLEKQIR